MEAEMAEVGTEYVMRHMLTTRKTGPPVLSKQGFGFNGHTPKTLPSWLSQEDLTYYVTKFDKTGFTGGLNYYRNLSLYLLIHFSIYHI